MNDLEEKNCAENEREYYIKSQRFRMVEVLDSLSACRRYKGELETMYEYSKNRAEDYDNAYNVLYELDQTDDLKKSLERISKEYNKYISLGVIIKQEIEKLNSHEDMLNKEYNPTYDPYLDADNEFDPLANRKEKQREFLHLIHITLTRIESRKSDLIKTKTVLLSMGENVFLKEAVNLIDEEIGGILFFINKLDEIKIRESNVVYD